LYVYRAYICATYVELNLFVIGPIADVFPNNLLSTCWFI